MLPIEGQICDYYLCAHTLYAIQEVGQLSQTLVGKYVFSNPILTWFTYILYASTMYKHIVGLILVTHEDLGVLLDHNNRFSII